MATTLTGRSTVQLANTFTEAGLLADAVQSVPINKSIAWADGTGANQAQVIWEYTGTLAGSAAIDHDLTSLSSPLGTVTITSLKELYLEVTTTTTAYKLQVGGDAASIPLFGAVADFIEVLAGGILYWASPVNGVTVTNATGDILQISNPSAGNVTYKLILKGVGSLA